MLQGGANRGRRRSGLDERWREGPSAPFPLNLARSSGNADQTQAGWKAEGGRGGGFSLKPSCSLFYSLLFAVDGNGDHQAAYSMTNKAHNESKTPAHQLCRLQLVTPSLCTQDWSQTMRWFVMMMTRSMS